MVLNFTSKNARNFFICSDLSFVLLGNQISFVIFLWFWKESLVPLQFIFTTFNCITLFYFFFCLFFLDDIGHLKMKNFILNITIFSYFQFILTCEWSSWITQYTSKYCRYWKNCTKNEQNSYDNRNYSLVRGIYAS